MKKPFSLKRQLACMLCSDKHTYCIHICYFLTNILVRVRAQFNFGRVHYLSIYLFKLRVHLVRLITS